MSFSQQRFLYRGVSKAMYEEGHGLKPKGTSLLKVLTHNGDFKYDGSMTVGESQANAILAHQLDSGKYPTSGVSTSFSFQIAKEYATYNGQPGYVYELDRMRFLEFYVEEFIVSKIVAKPYKPFDDEVIIRSAKDIEIPFSLVSKVVAVNPVQP
ncbi:MAG: hypothetical protein K9G46_03645 [Flavobacteriales bacterium]|nr:hypothetical protein [Flavobacteriales bacterium]